jgi:alpha-beta hydrolase superfamily lysophospholipase
MKSYFWNTEDGTKLYGQSWIVENPIAKICLVHGMGEHIGRYTHVAKFYNSKGISIYGYDQRGHGKSEGKRGHAPSFQHLINDLKEFISTVNKEDESLPTLLYGHSMGGNVVLNFTILHPEFQVATIATSPWIELAFKPPSLLVFIAKLLRKILPAFTQSTNLDTSAISQDPEVVSKYETDPLVHSTISTAMAVDLMNAGEYLLSHNESLKIPVLIMHGSDDQLTSFNASVKFIDNHPEVVFKAWQGMFHETHNELEKQKVFNYGFTWINDLIKQL